MTVTIGEMINNQDKNPSPSMLRYHGLRGKLDHYPRKHAPR